MQKLVSTPSPLFLLCLVVLFVSVVPRLRAQSITPLNDSVAVYGVAPQRPATTFSYNLTLLNSSLYVNVTEVGGSDPDVFMSMTLRYPSTFNGYTWKSSSPSSDYLLVQQAQLGTYYIGVMAGAGGYAPFIITVSALRNGSTPANAGTAVQASPRHVALTCCLALTLVLTLLSQ